MSFLWTGMWNVPVMKNIRYPYTTTIIWRFKQCCRKTKLIYLLFLFKINYFPTQFEYNLIVASAPAEKTQGCKGWKSTSNIPKSFCGSWSWSRLSGTISGFCNKSLKVKYFVGSIFFLINRECYNKLVELASKWFIC